MDYRKTRIVAGAFALIFCASALFSLSLPATALPVETHYNLTPIARPAAWSAVASIGDYVYVIGGCTGSSPGSVNLDTVQIYNIKTGETTFGTNMPTGVAAASSGVGPDGKIYIVGGWNYTLFAYNLKVQIYDPALDSWTEASGTIPESLGRSAYAMAPDGRLYIFGSGWAWNVTMIYNTQTNVWRYGLDQPVSGIDADAVYYSPTAIYVIGGLYSSATSVVNIYNPVANSWSSAASLPITEAFGSSALARNGYIYVFGGAPSTSPSYATPYSFSERYSVSEDTWEYASSSLSSGRMHAGAVVDSYGRVLVVGGWDGTVVVDDVEAFATLDISADYAMQISSPQDGSIVSGVVAVQVELINGYGGGFSVIDLFVDGVLHESRTYAVSATFLWDTTGLVDGSAHTLMARGFFWTGTVEEATVTVTVSAMSVAEKVAGLEQQVALLQTDIDALASSVDGVQGDVDSLQTQLASLQTQLNSLQSQLNTLKTNQTSQSSQLDQLQTQLDALQDSLDKVKTTSDSSNTWGMVNMVLVIVVIVLLGLMFVMSRKGKGPPAP